MRHCPFSVSLRSPAETKVEVAARNAKAYPFPSMKVQDIEQEALGLTEKERADLVLSLMSSLAAPEGDAPDEEVLRRDAELETGRAEPMLHEEFVRRVREERGR
jgi:hypothetical protein